MKTPASDSIASASALSKLMELVESDASLDAKVRDALAADLATEKPADLTNLRLAILGGHINESRDA
jgi:hypothetical protein